MSAADVRNRDRLVLDDGTEATVTDLRYGEYWLSTGRGHGIAVSWRAGSSSGVMFRRGDEILRRLTR